MILDNSVNIRINASNFKHYIQYYKDIECGSTINVSIKNLHIGTDTKINVKCDICGTEKKLSYKIYLKNFSKYQKYACCRKCAQFKIEKTCLNIYGETNPFKSEAIKNKIKITNKEKYGTEYVFQSEEIKNKIKITNNKKYCVDYPQQNKEIIGKSNITNIKRYGYNRSSQNDKIKDKISKKIKASWNKKLLDNEIISISGTTYELMCDTKEHSYFIEKTLLYNRKHFCTKLCTVCNPINSNSGGQQQLVDYIRSIYNDEILINNRKFLNNKYEIDIFLPKLNIGIEFNGLYWHSTKYIQFDYHYKKYLKSKENGILLLQIWEDDWKLNQNGTKTIIKNKIYNINNIYCDDFIIIDNMNPLDLENYKLYKNIEPNKYYVKEKVRYNYEIDEYDSIVYDAGKTIYKKI